MAFKVTDFHTHPFVREDCNTCFYDGIVSRENFAQDLKRAGIQMCCGSVIERLDGSSFDQIKRLNDEAVCLRDALDGFYVPGMHIHPLFPKQSVDEIYRMHSKGVRLIGELVPYYMNWTTYYDENMKIIFDAAQQLNMVVSAHTSADNPQLADSLEQAVKRFPRLKFVAAHPGDRAAFERHIERLKKYDNYYLDLSGTGIFRYGLIKHGVDAAGSEKLIFGTDFPICNPQMYVNAVLYERLRDKDYENIFYKNAERLLGE